MLRLQAYDWPGNIRELRNVLERARLYADDGVVRAEHLPDHVGQAPMVRIATEVASGPLTASAPMDDAALRRWAEASTGTRRELAQQLGLSERTLYRRLKALGL